MGVSGRNHHREDLRSSSDYDSGYGTGLRTYGGGGSGDRRQLEIVKGNVLSASQTGYSYSAPSPPQLRGPSPDPPFPPPRRRGRSSGSASLWCFSDPEMRRRKRVASYKAYAVEGKLKASLRKGFRWIKVKCSALVHGR
ncbi:uncharacterized protein LOC141814153 [Curcuma longa]|uniref:uncharacterized protein LOC141814153 n=1 Tax=Curcuma longa TaxID=136217 RepID=UPI003D9F200E